MLIFIILESKNPDCIQFTKGEKSAKNAKFRFAKKHFFILTWFTNWKCFWGFKGFKVGPRVHEFTVSF